MAITLHLGLGGRARDVLISNETIVSVWPLAEIYRTRIRDIAYDRNDGTLTNGSGMTRGVTIDIPEGALGMTFDGTGYVLIPDDGAGYTLTTVGGVTSRNLSCAGGSFSIIAYVKTTTNDATLRAIYQKCVTNSSGVGVYAAIQSGAAVFSMRNSGGSVFNFSRGAIADGVGRWIVFSYDAPAGHARIYIAGSQSGATVAVAAGTEADYTSAPARIGMFNDGAGAFTGTLSYVALARNENTGLAALLQATVSWTDVTSHLRDETAEIITGTPGTTLRDRQAGIGTFTFTLNNTPSVSGTTTLGYYTIGHANQRSGFGLGIPVKFTDGSLIRFRGWLSQADPEANAKGGRRTFCQAVDWFSVASVTPVVSVPILTNVRSDRAFAALIDETDQPPVAVSLSAGSEQFPFVFDRVSGTVLSEMADVVASEGGQAYIVPNSTTGGVVTFEGRGVRQLDVTPDATYDQTMVAMSVNVRSDAIINIVNPTITPREVSLVDTDVLYLQERRQQVYAGIPYVVQNSYQDPDQSQLLVGGTDFQTFTAGVDYTYTENEDGSGSNYIAYLTESHVFGGSGFTIEFNATQSGWVAWQVRGRKLLSDTPVTPSWQVRESVRKYGPHPYDEELKYLDSTVSALSFAQLASQLFYDTPRIPSEVVFRPSPGSALDTSVRARTLGNLLALGDPQSAVTTTQRYWVQNERLQYRIAGSRGGQTLVQAAFGVFPFAAQADSPFGAWDVSYWDDSLWGF
jgi:hypothetical protein